MSQQSSGSRIRIAPPAAGTLQNLATPTNAKVHLDFDTKNSKFSRAGSDLVIDTEGAGKNVLVNFFAVGNQELSTFTLVDGTVVSGDSFLKANAPDMNISTAAGPSSSASATGSGSGNYSDESGDLVGGVSRFNVLDSQEAAPSTSGGVQSVPSSSTHFTSSVETGNSGAPAPEPTLVVEPAAPAPAPTLVVEPAAPAPAPTLVVEPGAPAPVVEPTPTPAPVTAPDVNDAPTADNVTAAVTEQTTGDFASVSGNLALQGNLVDADITDTHTFSIATPAGTYGSINITDAATGAYTYTLNAASEGLAAGQTATENFTFVVSDGHGGTVTKVLAITVTGTNDAPTADNVTAAVTEQTTGDFASVSGNLALQGNLVDADITDTHTFSIATPAGTYGSINITDAATGAYTYSLNAASEGLAAGQTATENFTFVVSDGHGGTVTKVLAITVTGTNDAPTADNVTAAVTEQTTGDFASVSGNLALHGNLVDADITDAHTFSIATPAGTYGSINITDAATGAYTYSLNAASEGLAAGQTATENFTFVVSDGHGGTVTKVLAITVTGTNDAPTADNVTAAVTEQTTGDFASVSGNLALQGNLVDADITDAHTFSIATPAGTYGSINITDAATGAYTYTLNAASESLAEGQTATENFTFVVSDGHGGTVTKVLAITVTGTNDAPTADNVTAAVTEQTTGDFASVSGNLALQGNLVDADITDAHTFSIATPAGTYGSINITDAATGAYTYTLNAASEGLAAGQTATENFTFVVSDGHGGTVTKVLAITVTGSDDFPTIGATVVTDSVHQYAIPAGGITITGDVDIDFGSDGIAATNPVTLTPPTGLTSNGVTLSYDTSTAGQIIAHTGNPSAPVFTISINTDGTFTYTQLAKIDGHTQNISFGVTATDSDGDSVTSSAIAIPVSGVDDRAVMYTGNVATNINGKIISADVLSNDAEGSEITAVTNGTYGTASIDPATGNILYKLADNAATQMPSGTAPVNDYVTYTATDAQGNSYEKTIEVVIVRQPSGTGLYSSDNAVEGETHQGYIPLLGDSNTATKDITTSANADVVKFGEIGKATINLAAGNDSITVIATKVALYDKSSIAGGEGNDTIIVTSTAEHAVQSGSSIDGGGGNDSIAITSGKDGSSGGSINLGTGADTVTITVTGSNFSGLYGSTVTVGAGDTEGDTYIVSATKSGDHGINSSTLTAGAGNDFVQVSGSSFALANNASIVTAAGDDTVILTSANVGISASSVNTGAGNDSVSITGGSGSTSHGLASASAVLLGDGNDTITVVTSRGHGLAGNSSINGGAGNDSISVSAAWDGLNTSSIALGTGADTVSLTTTGSGVSSLYASKITVGAGDTEGDTYLLSATNTGAHGMHSSSITAGDGHDFVQIYSSQFALSNASAIHTAGGNDTVMLESANSVLSSSTITTGSGNDFITMTGTGTASVLYNSSTLQAGEGSDTVHIDAAKVISLNDAGHPANSEIGGGAGDDLIMFHSSAGTGAIYNASLTVDGGANESVNHATADGGATAAGDILAFGDNMVSQMDNLSTGTTHNFEALLLDYGAHPMQNLPGSLMGTESADVVSLGKLLETAGKLNAEGTNHIDSLIIKGSDVDKIDFGTHSSSVEHQADNVTIAGVEGTFTSYTVDAGGEEMHLYVENLIKLTS